VREFNARMGSKEFSNWKIVYEQWWRKSEAAKAGAGGVG